ncbi:MAG: ABC transporter substrate-binding protein [Solirubrobacteraceae bacterium]|nr:ABC transporter substrate-binding protein [Solirubrobacteraceae bacterium]
MSQTGRPADHDAPPEQWTPAAPLSPPRTSQARLTPAAEARTIVASRTTSTLATLSDDGTPWASMISHGALPDGTPVIMVSTLAEHGRNLEQDQRASISVVSHDSGRDPLDQGRVTLAGRVERPEGDELAAAEAAYIAAVPAAALFARFGDFTTWVLRVDRVRWVGGFGTMDSVTADDYAAAVPDPVIPGAAGAVRHLNADHADALLQMAQALGGQDDATSASCKRADHLGLDLAAKTPRGPADVRIAFDEPLTAPAQLRAATVALTKRARGLLGVVLLALALVLGAGTAAPTDAHAAPAKVAKKSKKAKAKTPYKRIVTLTPFTSNVVSRLGLTPRAVGDDAGSNIRLHKRARKARRLPMSHPNGPSLEQLIRVKPDLILSSPNWRAGTKGMKSQGFEVIDGWEPMRVNNVSPAVRRIARKVGRASKAKAITRRIDRNLRAARKNYKSRPKVLVVLGIGRATMAFRQNSWGGDIVRYAGGRLLTGDGEARYAQGLPGSFAAISDEQVLRENPDVIIVVPHGNSGSIREAQEFFKTKPGWSITNAAKNGRIHISDPDTLLQASDDPARVVRKVRKSYLKNW